VENVYSVLQQIYSGNGMPSFVNIACVLQEILQTTFWSLFSWTQCRTTVTATRGVS